MFLLPEVSGKGWRALVIFCALLAAAAGWAPAQEEPAAPRMGGLIEPDPLSAFEAELRALDEEALFEKAEGFRLAERWKAECFAFRILLERFPQGTHAAKAAYELAWLGLEDTQDWSASVRRMRDVAESYAGTLAGQAAAQYYQALTAPRNALHVELLTLLQKQWARRSERPMALNFLCLRTARFHKELPLLDWVSEDGDLSSYDKADIGRALAEALFLAAEFGESRRVCEWLVSSYPSQQGPCASALAIAGDIELKIRGNAQESEAIYRRIIKDYPSCDVGGYGLYLVAGRHFVDEDYDKARALLQEVRAKWPASRWAQSSLSALREPRMVARFGPPAEDPSQLQSASWLSRFSPRRLFSREASPAQTQAQANQRPAQSCGTYAYERVCGRLGLPARPEGAAMPSSDSMSLAEVARALRARGLSVQGQKVGAEALARLASRGDSALVLHLPDHFAVLESADASGVILRDSLQSSRRMSYERLAFQWDGYMLRGGQDEDLTDTDMWCGCANMKYDNSCPDCNSCCDNGGMSNSGGAGLGGGGKAGLPAAGSVAMSSASRMGVNDSEGSLKYSSQDLVVSDGTDIPIIIARNYFSRMRNILESSGSPFYDHHWVFSQDLSLLKKILYDIPDMPQTLILSEDFTTNHSWFNYKGVNGSVTRYASWIDDGGYRTLEGQSTGWTETFSDGRERLYNTYGRITKELDPNGNFLTYEPTDRDHRRMTKITQSKSGRGVALVWSEPATGIWRLDSISEIDISGQAAGPKVEHFYGSPEVGEYTITKTAWYDSVQSRYRRLEVYDYETASPYRLTRVRVSETGGDGDLRDYRSCTYLGGADWELVSQIKGDTL